MNSSDNSKQSTVTLTLDELVLLNNALNEVLNGVDIGEQEFATRLGASQEPAAALLSRLRNLVDARNA